MTERVVLQLDSYEAANLLWLLDALWNWQQRDDHDLPLQSFNTGDWVGQVPGKLADAMLVAGRDYLSHEPNGGAGPCPTTREMVARCSFGKCPHCNQPYAEPPDAD